MTTARTMSQGRGARSDGDLVAALVDGDLGALSALYRRHASLAYGLALRMTGDAARAADVVESAFMSLWRDRAESGAEIDPVRPRLVQLVAREAMADMRRDRPLSSSAAIDPHPVVVMRQPLPGLPQGS